MPSRYAKNYIPVARDVDRPVLTAESRQTKPLPAKLPSAIGEDFQNLRPLPQELAQRSGSVHESVEQAQPS